MRVVVALEHRFFQTPDGAVWTPAALPYSHTAGGYLLTFDAVRILARVRRVPNASPNWRRADGRGVSFTPVPHYRGPSQFLLKLHRINSVIRSAVSRDEAIIIRAPSAIGNLLSRCLDQANRPYALEVIGDPYDVFAPGAVRHLLRPFFRFWFYRSLKLQCARACAVAYVTAGALQCRYPPRANALAVHFSDAELPESAFIPLARRFRERRGAFTLLTVASLEQPYKGTDVLIEAVRSCVKAGVDLKLVVVGDGKYRRQLEAQAAAPNLNGRTTFVGTLPAGEAVRKFLDRADLFVLPSKAEGLPRAMLEAMARGLPCIGSKVGGIPELLASEDLVPSGNAVALAEKLQEVVASPERMSIMSARNLEKAQEYRHRALVPRRNAFHEEVRRRTMEGRESAKS